MRIDSLLGPIGAAIFAALAVRASAQAPAAPVIDVVRDATYVVRDGVALKLDAYRPAGAGVLPAVVVIHGGGWSLGGKAIAEAPVLARQLARAGFAAVSVSYRLAPKAVWPAQIDDVRRAMQFVRAHAGDFGVDPTRVGALGASAGGHLAALLATTDDVADAKSADPVLRQSSRARCAVSICGPMDLEDQANATPMAIGMVLRLLTGTNSLKDPETIKLAEAKVRSASPKAFVGPGDAPLLLLYGDRDPLVPTSHATAMQRAMQAAGASCEAFPVKGGHCEFIFRLQSRGAPEKEVFWRRTLDFLAAEFTVPAASAADDGRPPSRPTSRAESAPTSRPNGVR